MQRKKKLLLVIFTFIEEYLLPSSGRVENYNINLIQRPFTSFIYFFINNEQWKFTFFLKK